MPRSAGRVKTSPEELARFGESLGSDDRVALETTGNALRIARILERHVAAVLVADTRNVRAITHAKVKNDRVDARIRRPWPERRWCPAAAAGSGAPRGSG